MYSNCNDYSYDGVSNWAMKLLLISGTYVFPRFILVSFKSL